MAKISITGKTVFYTTGGRPWQEGQPLLLLLHGAGGNQSVWVYQSRALGHGGWNIAVPDLPGHGYSEDAAAKEGLDTVESYAAWTADLLEALGAKRAVVGGHSMGAGIALTLAATRPQLVGGLLLVGTRAEMAVSTALLRDSGENPVRAARFIAAYGHGQGSQLGQAPQPGNWLLGSAQALTEACPAPVLQRDFNAAHNWRGSGYAAQVRCPTLVLSGAEDRMTPARMGAELAQAIPGAQFISIPAAGHFLMSEAPRPVLKAMRTFLHTLNL